jgi:hypothetical protein
VTRSSAWIRTIVSLAFLGLACGLSKPSQAQATLGDQKPIPASQLALARSLVEATGMLRSIEPIVPNMQQEMTRAITQTRPEIAKDLAGVFVQLKPDLDKKTEDLVTVVSAIFAQHLSEADLKESVAFFTSAAGKKYVAAQPVILDEVVTAMESFNRFLSGELTTMVRTELKKKGVDF